MGIFHVAKHGDFPWDRNAFKLAEAVALEDATGRLFDELVLAYNGKRRLGVAAFAWLAMRRNGVRVPWREFFEGLDLLDITETFEDEVAEAPAEEEAPADPPASAAVKTKAKPAAPRRPTATERKRAASGKR